METPFPPFEPNGPETVDRGPRFREISPRLLVPNLITVLAICAGMTGVRLAFEDRFETAVVMVLIAAFLDGVDGRVARLMKATSKFGVQMDSLADIVNFGVAPALVLYAFLLDQANSFGWIAAMMYAVAAGLRLARFNVMAERETKAVWQSDYFLGVPAPAGAMLVLLPVYLGFLGVTPGPGFAYAGSVFTLIVGFFLVSRLPVYSGKSLSRRIRRELVPPLILLAALYVAVLMSFPWQTMTLTAVVYLLCLPLSARAWTRRYGVANAVSAGEEGV